MGVRTDFVVDSDSQCFICLQQISTHLPDNVESSLEAHHSLPIYSLQSLSSFLKVNMEKVFKGNERIPLHLLEKVQQSRLKAELCDECTRLVKNFSRFYIEFEKIRMVLTSSLELIYDKLKESEEFYKSGGSSTSTDISNSGNDRSERLDIMKILRMETIQKCSLKLTTSSLRVRLHNMTRKKVAEERTKFKNSVFPSTTISRSQKLLPDHLIKIGHDVKTEYQPVHSNLDEDDDYIDSSFPEIELSAMKSESNLEQEKHPPADRGKRTQRVPRRRGGTNKIRNYYVEIAPVGLEKAEIPKSVFNRETGRYKCQLCQSEFGYGSGYKTHFKNMHLKIRYKCSNTSCGKIFTQLSQCFAHHRTIHLGFRFSCVCGSQYTEARGLQKHRAKNMCDGGDASKVIRRQTIKATHRNSK